MNDASRTQGGLICVGVVVVGALFLLGLLQKSYWALAIPVAALVLFALGLTFWVGYTIATIQVDPSTPSEPASLGDATRRSAPTGPPEPSARADRPAHLSREHVLRRPGHLRRLSGARVAARRPRRARDRGAAAARARATGSRCT